MNRRLATLAAASVLALIGCNQSLGPNEGLSVTEPESVIAARAAAANAGRVTICHKTGNGYNLITVSGNAVQAHLGHGDHVAPEGATSAADCALDPVDPVDPIDPGPFTAFASGESSGKTVMLTCEAGVIQVISGLYGENCVGGGYSPVAPSAADPDKTWHLAETCDGETSCAYTVNHTVIGDPFFGCRKDYEATWTCVP